MIAVVLKWRRWLSCFWEWLYALSQNVYTTRLYWILSRNSQFLWLSMGAENCVNILYFSNWEQIKFWIAVLSLFTSNCYYIRIFLEFLGVLWPNCNSLICFLGRQMIQLILTLDWSRLKQIDMAGVFSSTIMFNPSVLHMFTKAFQLAPNWHFPVGEWRIKVGIFSIL